MNILFHTTAAIGLIAVLNDTKNSSSTSKYSIQKSLVAFGVGIVSHGALDYIPHCYPINAKIDVILGLLMIVLLTIKSKPNYRLIVAATFLGSIFPDVIDLSPQILNKYLGLSLPIQEKLFPWHWEKYSGSIFSFDCKTSALNHSILVCVVAIMCIARKDDLKYIFRINNSLQM